MKRREFLQGALAAGASALLPSFASADCRKQVVAQQNSVQSRIHRYIDDLHSFQMPHVREIRSTTYEGMNKLLVVIRQVHRHPKNTTRMWRSVDQSQAEMRELIDYFRLHPRIQLKRVLQEGVLNGREKQDIGNDRVQLRWDIRKLLKNPTDADIAKAMDDPKVLQTQVEGVSLVGWYGAAETMACSDELDIVGAEDWELDEKIEDELVNFYCDKQKLDQWIIHDREDQCLKFAADMREEFVCTVWGKNHRFDQNVHDWNTDTSNTVKFGLTEIITAAIDACEKDEVEQGYTLVPEDPYVPHSGKVRRVLRLQDSSNRAIPFWYPTQSSACAPSCTGLPSSQ